MGRERFAEVAIVGGGVMGASIAAHLAERKVGRVVVFEREDALGTGSTAKAAGGVRLQFTTAANVALSRYSMEEIRNFRERTGVDADFAQDGYLFLLNSEEDLRRFSETAVVQRALGAPVEVITPEEAARILPGIVTDDLVGATFCGEDGVATPAALVAGYGSLARRSGAELRRGCEVTSVSVVAGGGFAFVAGGERWECDWLVNAAGPWAGQVGALLGVEVPVSPMRRQFFTTEPLSWVPKKMPLTIDWGTGVYMHVHSGGMLIGNSDPDESPGFSQTPDLDYLAGVWEDAARRLPRVEEASMKTLNAGLYEVSPDHNAILGPVPEIAAIRAGERVLRARDAARPGGGEGDFGGDRGRGVADAGYHPLLHHPLHREPGHSRRQRDLTPRRLEPRRDRRSSDTPLTQERGTYVS